MSSPTHSDPYRLHGKVAFVTGATRGIGAAIAVELAKRGAKVVVNYAHSHDDAHKVVHRIKHHGGEAVAIKADVGDPHAVKKLLEGAVAHFGHVDIVSSTWAFIRLGILRMLRPRSEFDAAFHVNTRGQYFLAHHAYCHLREKGRIILTAWHKGHHKHSVNSACEGAIDGLVKSLAVDCGDKKITVNAVAPAAIKEHKSREHDHDRHDCADEEVGKVEEVEETPATPSHHHRLGHPVDVARVVTFLASDAAEWVSGEVIGVDGGTLH
ncbi:hypothetical protein BJY00DRAFT_318431 [Aspergillus carlsbadensis]|nr:hypothetical protein BJY00DRAFT_318431 [Aspergillus carlsbadensis]